MKQQEYVVPWQNREVEAEAVKQQILALPEKTDVEIVLRDPRVGKTLRQLRGHFGVIIDQISEYTGHDTDYCHRWMKALHLSKIYAGDPETSDQEQWVELLIVYQQSGERAKLERHAKRISLSWASIGQMREFIEKVLAYCWSNDIPVDEPDPRKRAA